MKKIYLFLFLAMTISVMALPPIAGKPNESWFSGDTNTNPLYKWVNAADGMIEAGMSLGTGQVFYVDSGVTTAGNGNSWDTAVTTIAGAIAKCVAGRGDVILVAQGHAETWASAAASATLSTAGVTIIGLGTGSLMPTITMTHVDATMTVSGADCIIKGIRFTANIDDTKVLLTLAATCDGTIVKGCEFRDSAANKDFLVGISVAAAADNIKLISNDFRTTAAAGGNNAILSAAVTDLNIIGNHIFGKFATGAILTSGVLTRCLISDNIVINAEQAIAIALSGTTSTGVLARNFLTGTTSQAAALTGDNALFCFENYINDTAGSSGLLNPAVDS